MSGALIPYTGVVDDARDQQIRELEDEVRALERQVADARAETAHVRNSAARGLVALRKQLTPLYRSLQSVFGELDAAGIDDAPIDSGGTTSRQAVLWNDWKAKLPPSCGKVIDALLLHADLSVRQIMASQHMGKDTVYQATSKLGQLKLVSKNGGRFSLKPL